mgnify:CR=1 FL=1
MIAYYNSPHYNIDAFNPFNIGSHNLLFNDVMHQLDKQFYYNQSQKMLAQISKPSSVKQVETVDGYQIQIAKKYGDFNGYEIRVIRDLSGDYFIKIEGNNDQFKKLYQLNPEEVEIGEIDWKWFRNENILVLNIPKSEHKYEERKKLKSVKKANCKKSDHRRKARHEKRLRRKVDKIEAALQEEQRQRNSEKQEEEEEEYQKQQEDSHCKLIRNEALFEHEENIEVAPSDSSTALESDSSSETETIESEPIKVKKNRLPSIEEVEDEEFILLRKNMI